MIITVKKTETILLDEFDLEDMGILSQEQCNTFVAKTISDKVRNHVKLTPECFDNCEDIKYEIEINYE